MTDHDSSGISFTALYTGAVWERHGLSEAGLTPTEGRLLYRLMTPFEAASRAVAGGSLRTFLLQRHRIIDALIAAAVREQEAPNVLEVACGLSPRGIRLRRQFPNLHMVESDLPDMASRKAGYLAATGHLGPRHQVVPLDILANEGPQSLETVIGELFPDGGPVVVVTEGLTSYFTLAQITPFWKRLAAVLSERPGSTYLSESYLQSRKPVIGRGLRVLGGALGRITQADVSFHFTGDEPARNWFLNCGFPDVTVHDPRNFYEQLPIPRSRGNPMVRIVEART
ncbi:leucine carboxyl methyltransferase [Tamilnaduibacter salinus]|uniref:Leucine carboxyl methyltransferase n=1 Tax=Tamilnaduibacter salinus TaxID=1484056 RepID=A0A2U1D1L1_9GAMM|nr:class I SAM-dependent methyltransferase [Tamilnaduibacter salinus]PVY79264.1 leucine carboxyl methyltransferase [Tamilnaduibacter salinus]